jgi:hypothetical protein
VGIRAEVFQIQHGHLAPAKPVGVTDLEGHRIAKQRQPAFAAGLVFMVDQIIDVMKEPLQFCLGERPLLSWHRVVRCVPGRVPF